MFVYPLMSSLTPSRRFFTFSSPHETFSPTDPPGAEFLKFTGRGFSTIAPDQRRFPVFFRAEFLFLPFLSQAPVESSLPF